MRLLRVVTAQVASLAGADAALAALRRAAPLKREGCALLLFCNLAPSALPRELADADVCRRLQAGVAALRAQLGGRVSLLVRRRAWDDAARAYLGAEQAQTPAETVASLILFGKARAAFEAATDAPASFLDAFDAVLFADAALACTPGTPQRMLDALEQTGAPCAGARVLPPPSESALGRLVAGGFSLSCFEAARRAVLAARGLLSPEHPALLCALPALCALAAGRGLPPAAVAPGCFFAMQAPPRVLDLLHAGQNAAARAFAAFDRKRPETFPAVLDAALPLVRLALLFAAALAGSAPLALSALLLPEYPALLCPSLLPGALARLALLPSSALCALHALLERLFARSGLIRPQISEAARGPLGAQAAGAALLLFALRGGGALAPLLAAALSWLAAPLLFSALEAPVRERIPLDAAERERLRALALCAADGADASPSAPLRMLCACARSMLGLWEPDEAARAAQALLPETGIPLAAHETAALLASAQFLRERMGACDAALRDLPARIESLAAPPAGGGPLAALLRAALEREEDAAPDLRPCGPADALFLPVALWGTLPAQAATLPLTHPHTFLRGALPKGMRPARTRPDPALRFLSLAAAALGEPFSALLLRSPAVAPYAPLLAASKEPARRKRAGRALSPLGKTRAF